MREPYAHLVDRALEDRALAKEHSVRASLDLGLQRLEEEHEGDRDERRVEPHRVEASEDRYEEVEDERERGREQRRDEEADCEVVEVRDALTDE